MNHEWFKARREELRNWKRIRQMLRHLLRIDSSDAFVERVMRKVEALPVPQPALRGLGLDRLTSRIPEWLYPELGLAAAATLLLLTLASLQRMPVSTEALLLNRLPQEDQWIGLSHASDWTGNWNVLSEGV